MESNRQGKDRSNRSHVKKVLLPLHGNHVAPRFDLATEVLIAIGHSFATEWEEKIVVLSQSSSEQICQLVFSERIDAVIVSGIEDEHYQYLTWKRVEVFDSVIGPWESALLRYFSGDLKSGDILFPKDDPHMTLL